MRWLLNLLRHRPELKQAPPIEVGTSAPRLCFTRTHRRKLRLRATRKE